MALALMLVGVVSADINIFVGGSAASTTNGGCATTTVDISDAVGTNGAAVDSAGSASVTNNGSGSVKITSTGAFLDAEIGMYAYCDFAATYVDGRYKITYIDVGIGDYIVIDLAYSADTTADVWVGGAVPESEFENIMDTIGYPSAPGVQTEQVYVRWYDGGDGYARSTEWGIDTGDGSKRYKRVLIGCDSSYEQLPAGSYARIYATASMTDLVDVQGAEGQVFVNVDFDGNSNAQYALKISSSSYYAGIIRCKVRNSTSFGCYSSSSYLFLYETEIANNGSDGFYGGTASNLQVLACNIHDNGGYGLRGNPEGGSWTYNRIYDNGSDGMFVMSATDSRTVIAYNTVYGNTGDGIQTDDSNAELLMFCNTMSGNGGYGYNIGGDFEDTFNFFVFGWNHSYNNTSGHTNLSGTWADFGLGNNITGDPKFTSTTDGSEDFTPQSDSPLINAGLHDRTIGAIEATYSGGGGSGGGLLSPIYIGN